MSGEIALPDNHRLVSLGGDSLVTIDERFAVPGAVLGYKAYSPEMCEQAVLLGAEGMSITEIAVGIGVTRSRLEKWAETHPEFGAALEFAQDVSQAWWEKQGRNGINGGKSFNAIAYTAVLRTRFRKDYSERVETLHKYDASEAFLKCVQAISGAAVSNGRSG
jgi:hypothetical protein